MLLRLGIFFNIFVLIMIIVHIVRLHQLAVLVIEEQSTGLVNILLTYMMLLTAFSTLTLAQLRLRNLMGSTYTSLYACHICRFSHTISREIKICTSLYLVSEGW